MAPAYLNINSELRIQNSESIAGERRSSATPGGVEEHILPFAVGTPFMASARSPPVVICISDIERISPFPPVGMRHAASASPVRCCGDMAAWTPPLRWFYDEASLYPHAYRISNEHRQSPVGTRHAASASPVRCCEGRGGVDAAATGTVSTGTSLCLYASCIPNKQR